ncbi:beta-galactosidase, partial [Candidatus Calescamantes bacterium]|nr:beta-galactosidase [Candidatus Calescamantes bacterium]
MQNVISYDNMSFLIRNERKLIISGEIHYFRLPRELWHDRLEKMRLCGLNTISTYIPWNYHEFYEGNFEFSGDKDIEHFFRLCRDMGFYIIARVGPYICAEWDFGGFPVWLNTKKGLK